MEKAVEKMAVGVVTAAMVVFMGAGLIFAAAVIWAVDKLYLGGNEDGAEVAED